MLFLKYLDGDTKFRFKDTLIIASLNLLVVFALCCNKNILKTVKLPYRLWQKVAVYMD